MTDHPGMRPDTKNILIIQLGDIGEVVLATSSFKALKESLLDAWVSVLVRKSYGALLEADPHLHEVIEVPKSGGKIAEFGRENLRRI